MCVACVSDAVVRETGDATEQFILNTCLLSYYFYFTVYYPLNDFFNSDFNVLCLPK